MTAKSQKVRLLLYRLDGGIVNPPQMADTCNELDNLAERDSSLSTAVLDHYSDGIVV